MFDISFVVCGRNDDYGENFLERVNNFISSISILSAEYKVKSEIIFIEWNPPENVPKLSEIIFDTYLHFKQSIQFIEVPNSIHKQYNNPRSFPVLDYLGKNVGIRRASGKFILVCSPDIIFQEDFFKFIPKLSKKYFYRTARIDFKRHNFKFINLEEYRNFIKNCEKNILTDFGNVDLEMEYHSKIKDRIQKKEPYSNACGDFLLASKEKWDFLQGCYEDTSLFSHLDSITLKKALLYFGQWVFPRRFAVFHCDHKRQFDNNSIDTEKSLSVVINYKNTDNWGIPNVLMARTKNFYPKVCITGGAGFIGSHLGKKLLQKGYYVIVADWKKNEYFQEKEYCDKFLLLDLRNLENCITATKECDLVFNLAADMGGMGFIKSNSSVLFYNNIMISFNITEACRRNKVKKLLYTSSACIYPENKQLQTDCKPLKESDDWPAQPQDTYGLEKLCSEQFILSYAKDFSFQVRIARLHNIYGPNGTWKGGREKSPSAFCRKIICSDEKDTIEMWGDGEQTRSFCYIDDCIKGLIKLMDSDFNLPLNIGSSEMISINDMVKLICSFENKNIFIKHIEGPEGVRGRCSDNTLTKKVLGWEPQTPLRDGLLKLYGWIKEKIKEEIKEEIKEDILHTYKSSFIVKQSTETLK